MPELSKQAEPAVKKLLKSDEEQLYEKLGIIAKAIEKDPSKSGSFEPKVTYDMKIMGPKEDVMELGQKIFNRWIVEAYKLVCGSDKEGKKDREDLMKAIGLKNEEMIAAALAALLVAQMGLAPAFAAVIAVIILKRFFRPAHEEFCLVWKKNLPG